MKNIYFLGIDIQNDFTAIPEHIKDQMRESNGVSFRGFEPALPIKEGWDDAINTANFISKNADKINKIVITMDTHEQYDVAHSLFWINDRGEHPVPFTMISYDDVKNKVWMPVDISLYEKMCDYTYQLERAGRFTLCIWPTHCCLGTLGHKLTKPFEVAVQNWERKNNTRAEKYLKGYYPLTENYGAVEAEVVDNSVAETMKNEKFLNELRTADVLFVSGQALSHCVSITIQQIVKYLGEDFAKKIVLLSDTTHPVAGFEDAAIKFLKEYQEKGMRVMTTQEVDFL